MSGLSRVRMGRAGCDFAPSAGLALCLGWMPLAAHVEESYHTVGYDVTAVALDVMVFCLAACVALVVVGRVPAARRVPCALAACMLAGTGALLWCAVEPGMSLGVFAMVASALSGAGTSAAWRLWFGEIRAEGPWLAVCPVLLTGAAVAIVAALGAFLGRSPWPVSAISLLGSVLTCALYIRRAGVGCGSDAPQGPSRSLRVRRFISFAVLGFIFSFMMLTFSTTSFAKASSVDVLGLLGGVVMAFLLFVAADGAGGDSPAFTAYRFMVLPIVIAFFPMNPGSAFSLDFAVVCSFVALETLFLVSAMVAQGYADMFGTSFDKPASAVGSALLAGAALGALASGVQHFGGCRGSDYGIFTMAICSIVAAFLVTNVLFIERDSMSGAYASTLRRAMAPEAGRRRFETQCDRVVRLCGLTEREGEVLRILARGHGLERVQNDLCISEGTAIFHRRNVYRKCGVHSRSELIDFVDAIDPEEETHGDVTEDRAAKRS